MAKGSNEEALYIANAQGRGCHFWIPLDVRQARAHIKANQSGKEVEGERRRGQPAARWMDPSYRDNGAPWKTRERMSTWTLGAGNSLKAH